MENTLEKRSGMLVEKSKFFIYRSLTYFSFLFIPIYIPKLVDLPPQWSFVFMIFYSLFMFGQWFLLGKEVDHRLRIYYRVNSSIDRVIYRALLGMFLTMIYFSILSFFPGKWIYNLFWVTWVVSGIFFSWPTRGKIIKESMSTNLGEFRYLDSFEKTLVGLLVILFLATFPELPSFSTISSLKLFFDPNELILPYYWDFVNVTYFPFKKYPDLLRMALAGHFYIIGSCFYLLCFYALCRYFVSRRLSLLAVFALLSSWSFSKTLAYHAGSSILGTYLMILVWSLLWCSKSSTYRSGLFMGLVSLYSLVLNRYNIAMPFLIIGLSYVFLIGQKTIWFRKQFLRYSILGIALSVIFIFSYGEVISEVEIFLSLEKAWENFLKIWKRKAFFALSFIGAPLIISKIIWPELKFIKGFILDKEKVKEMFVALGIFFLYGIFFDENLYGGFSLMWPIALVSIFPLEFLFQSMSRFRSNRNMIFLIYIIVCLLDSHFEGRVKILMRMIN